MKDLFQKFSQRVSCVVGSPAAFMAAALTIVVWGAAGPVFHFSDTWQLVINTSTTIITFLMVFLIQSTQNRDAKAIHLKLDELIHAIEGARNILIDAETMSDEELSTLEQEFKTLRTSETLHLDVTKSASGQNHVVRRKSRPKKG